MSLFPKSKPEGRRFFYKFQKRKRTRPPLQHPGKGVLRAWHVGGRPVYLGKNTRQNPAVGFLLGKVETKGLFSTQLLGGGR